MQSWGMERAGADLEMEVRKRNLHEWSMVSGKAWGTLKGRRAWSCGAGDGSQAQKGEQAGGGTGT